MFSPIACQNVGYCIQISCNLYASIMDPDQTASYCNFYICEQKEKNVRNLQAFTLRQSTLQRGLAKKGLLVNYYMGLDTRKPDK